MDTTGEAIRATATLAWSSLGPPEIGVLVEDAWFRRGLGRALCAEIAAEASRAGVPGVVACIQGDNHRAMRFAHALAPDAPSQLVDGELVVLAPIPAPAAEPTAGDGRTPGAPRDAVGPLARSAGR